MKYSKILSIVSLMVICAMFSTDADAGCRGDIKGGNCPQMPCNNLQVHCTDFQSCINLLANMLQDSQFTKCKNCGYTITCDPQ